MRRLVIIGAGGHGAVVAEAAAGVGLWADIRFLDDDDAHREVLGYPIVGTLGDLGSQLGERTEFLVALGSNRKRLTLLDEIAGLGGTLATIVHSAAVVSNSATIDVGTVLCAGAIVNARATIGRGCILNTGCTVDHDCVLGDGVHVSPGANVAGNVTVGNCAWVGIGASVREGVLIGKGAIVGAGSAVISDVADHSTVGGVPAREL